MYIISKTRKKYKSIGNEFVDDENGTLAGLEIKLDTGSTVDVVVKCIIHEEHSVTCEIVEQLYSKNFAQKQIIRTGQLTNQRMVADNTSYVNSLGVLVSNDEALTPIVLDENNQFIIGGGELKEGYYPQFLTMFAQLHEPIFAIVYDSLESKY
jgi:hypothetical protein